MQLCNCIQNHSQPTETAVARIPAAENSRFFIDTTSIELALLIEEYTCKSCTEVQLYCSSYFLTVPKEHIRAVDSKLLSGSVDVETALTATHPIANRWDYGIGYRPTNLADEVVYWVEVHPAGSDGAVNVVLAKLAWLQSWLSKNKDQLGSMKRPFIWISSGSTSFTPNSPQQKHSP